MTLTRKTVDYDPRLHLHASYPTWHVTTAHLCGVTDHIACAEAKLVIVDPAAFDGCEDWALAHVAAHLDVHMAQLGELTEDQCSQADCLAQIRMDRECDRT